MGVIVKSGAAIRALDREMNESKERL